MPKSFSYDDTPVRKDPVFTYVKWGVTAVIAIALLILGSCSFERVQPDAGFEAVLVKKPIFFGHGGIDPTPVKTGSAYIARTTQAIMVNMQPQQFSFAAEDMMSENGIPLHLDPKLRL